MALASLASLSINNKRLEGVDSWDLDEGDQIDTFDGDSQLHRHFVASVQQRPRATFQSRQLIDLLSGTGILVDSTDTPLAVLNATNGLVAVERLAADNKPGDATGSVHRQVTGLRGVAFMSGLAWSGPGAKAVASLETLFTSLDGSAAALSEALVAAPADHTVKEGLTLTTATFAGAALTTVRGLNLAIDPKLAPEFDNSKPFPKFYHGGGLNGPCDISCSFDLEDLAAASALHKASGNLVLTFTSFAHGGGLGATGVTITLNGSWARRQRRRWGQGSPSAASVVVQGLWDGSNKPMAWGTF